MSEQDFSTFINGVGNDLKIAIDDIIGVISNIHEDVEKLKIKTSKPNKNAAQALLEYIAMDDCRSKTNMEILCGDEIKQYFRWLEEYCKEYCCTQEDVLNKIIEGNL